MISHLTLNLHFVKVLDYDPDLFLHRLMISVLFTIYQHKKKSAKGSLQAGTISISMVFFHYSLDISFHQSTHFTLGFHLYSVLVLLIMQSWCTQTIIMYLTASALGICYIGLLLTNRPQTQKMKRVC